MLSDTWNRKERGKEPGFDRECSEHEADPAKSQPTQWWVSEQRLLIRASHWAEMTIPEYPCHTSPLIGERLTKALAQKLSKVYPAEVTIGGCQLSRLLTAEKRVLFGGILSTWLLYGCYPPWTFCIRLWWWSPRTCTATCLPGDSNSPWGVRTSVNLHIFHHTVSLVVTVHLKIHLGLNPLGMLLAKNNRGPDKQRLKPKGSLMFHERKSRKISQPRIWSKGSVVSSKTQALCVFVLCPPQGENLLP